MGIRSLLTSVASLSVSPGKGEISRPSRELNEFEDNQEI